LRVFYLLTRPTDKPRLFALFTTLLTGLDQLVKRGPIACVAGSDVLGERDFRAHRRRPFDPSDFGPKATSRPPRARDG
jgi:hypothetical protein